MIHRLIGSIRQNLVAWLALFVALGGTSLAAKHYLINSTKQINPKVLRALQGRTGPPGARGATGAAGLIGLTGSPGKEGAQGKEGLQGKEGTPGPSKLSAIKEVAGSRVFVGPEKAGESIATCPKGTRAIGGGSFVEGEPTSPGPNIYNSHAEKGRTEWVVEIGNPGKVEAIGVEAIAYCAGENEAVAG
jgi:hypothetical protein